MIGLPNPKPPAVWWSKVKRWLQFPEAETNARDRETANCVCCGGRRSSSKESLGLCMACFNAIPWIMAVRCPVCGRPDDCLDCVRRTTCFFRYSRSAVRYDPLMKEWLASYKYRGNERLLPLFSGMLVHAYHQLVKELPAAGQEGSGFHCISYAPMNVSRLAERGFNQAEAMAVELGRRLSLPVVPLLERTRHTAKQSFKSRGERLNDLQGAFKLLEEATGSIARLEEGIGGQGWPVRVLLLDDVYTTGSTLNQCAQTITQSLPVEVYGLMWAR
ncbi:ComF family protein [Paenibacillus sp. GbtcB18]|uniref:ComF family protein n=1 Tax=Paenibacillus sp. GbtcB18 TaxID=2824763 RepID=UPI001C30AE79|nr:ComF family protein [Paenibacillus sp. GbtcB18]